MTADTDRAADWLHHAGPAARAASNVLAQTPDAQRNAGADGGRGSGAGPGRGDPGSQRAGLGRQPSDAPRSATG